jgi:nitrogen PTS system EIIA component
VAELTVRDVARLLGVAEKTVWRWVEEGELPHYRLRGEVQFNPVELQEWAQARGRPVRPAPPQAGADVPDGLAAAVSRGGIVRDLPGATRDEVLAAIAALPGVPAGVDRALLRDLLLSRERLGSTGLGDGIAFPHPRDPIVLAREGTTVILAFLARPLEFGALDGRPVTTLFTILAPSVAAHLAALAGLAFALHDPTLRAVLAARAPDAEIFAALGAAERREAPRPPAQAEPDEEET